MGQIQRRPEDVDDWGGLPSEPAASDPAEELGVAEAVDAAAFGLGGASGIESVVVALPPTPPDPTPGASTP